MGTHRIFIGKGIIIPTVRFISKYLDEIRALCNPSSSHVDAQKIISTIVKRHFGDDYDICPLGHDAFECRADHSMLDVFGNTAHAAAYEIIKHWRDELRLVSTSDFPFTSVGMGDLMFIGRFKTLDAHGGEFNYYVGTSELLYGLSALLPQIVAYYGELSQPNYEILGTTFGQQPCIWTFASDCHCCG